MPSTEDFVTVGWESTETTNLVHEAEDSRVTNNVAVESVNYDEQSQTAEIFEAGMKREPKRLYPKDQNSVHVEWVDKIPDKVADQSYGYGDAWKEYAILLHTNLKQGEQPLNSITIQSPLLKSKLNSIFQGYPGFFLSCDKSSIDAPFRPFVHCWDIFTQFCDDESETGKHMRLLKSALEPELQESFSVIKEFRTQGMIRFDQLWTIFKPGSLVYSESNGIERVYRLSRTEINRGSDLTRKYFLLHCYYIDWDGETYGHALDFDGIEIFEGSKKYTSLGIYPLEVHPERAAVVARLVDRGKKYSSYTGVHYLAFEGLATRCEYASSAIEEHVTGRVVVDTATFMHFNPYSRRLIQRFGAKEPSSEDRESAYNRTDMSYAEQDIYYNLGILTEKAISNANKKSAKMNQVTLTEDQLIICSPTVRGYSLTLNQWMNLRIDLLQDIGWNKNAFDSLALPGNHKELLLAFAKTQGDSAAQFDDVIVGKGRGLVVLLEGPPGLGKTLTVESLAEEMRVPIYKLTNGDMKPAPEFVKKALEDAFFMTKAWKGIVLLDEADIFLESRSVNDLDRNQLVSVFLQHLEYFEGTLFLTTNRVECIDPAFESRIHLSLTYPKLTQDLRHKIWKNFIRTLKVNTSQITDAHLDKFAGIDMNGRQIKNTVKMCALLAAKADHCLTAEHVEMMLAINQSK